MNYALAKELRDAGFPQNKERSYFQRWEGSGGDNAVVECDAPTLNELIAGCGESIYRIDILHDTNSVYAYAYGDREGFGSTVEEAVANLYLALHAKEGV